MEPSKPSTELSLAEQRRAEVIEPGHTFSTVTDKISAIVLKRKTPTGWFLAFAASFSLLMVLLFAVGKLFRPGDRDLGRQPAGRLGICDCQFRLVDRNRPRGHADLGDPAAAAAEMADFDQSLRRSHDAVRGLLRGALSDPAPGPSLAGLLAVSVPEHDVALAAVPQPAHLGRVRGVDVRHGVAAVLVRRIDSRSGHASRPVDAPDAAVHLRHAGDGLARLGAPLASLRDGVAAAGGPGDAAGGFGPHDRQLRFRRVDHSRAGTPRFFRRTLSPGRFIRASRW